jgi:hypothetical protein
MTSAELARRGAEVVAIDISPALIGIARDRAARGLHRGRSHSPPATCWRPIWAFDHVVAMDSMIYYTAEDDRRGARRVWRRAPACQDRLHRRPAHAVPDGVLHRRKAVPAVRPVADHDPAFAERIAKNGSARRNRVCFRGGAVSRGFYISEPAWSGAHEHAQAHIDPRAALRGCGERGVAAGAAPALSLFQVSVGMATVMLLGTLNRVMIVELRCPRPSWRSWSPCRS